MTSNGVHFHENKSFFVPLALMNRREISIYRYWVQNSDKLFTGYRSYRGFAMHMSGYIFDDGGDDKIHHHRQRGCLHIPVDVANRLMASFHTYFDEYIRTGVAWQGFWHRDSVLNATHYQNMLRQ